MVIVKYCYISIYTTTLGRMAGGAMSKYKIISYLLQQQQQQQQQQQTCKTACLRERMQPPSRRPEVAVSASLPPLVQNDSSRSNEPCQDHVTVWAP